MTDDDQARCRDCQTPTAPCTGKRGCRHKGRWEYYMVHDHIWDTAGADHGYLCIGCLENRMARRLTAADFTDAPINDPTDPWHTDRLTTRLVGDHEPGTPLGYRRKPGRSSALWSADAAAFVLQAVRGPHERV